MTKYQHEEHRDTLSGCFLFSVSLYVDYKVGWCNPSLDLQVETSCTLMQQTCHNVSACIKKTTTFQSVDIRNQVFIWKNVIWTLNIKPDEASQTQIKVVCYGPKGDSSTITGQLHIGMCGITHQEFGHLLSADTGCITGGLGQQVDNISFTCLSLIWHQYLMLSEWRPNFFLWVVYLGSEVIVTSVFRFVTHRFQHAGLPIS